MRGPSRSTARDNRTKSGIDYDVDKVRSGGLYDFSILGHKVATDTLGPRVVIPASLTANEIAPRTIGPGRIASESLTANEIAPETIGSGRMIPRSITADRIGLAVITAVEIAPETIGSGRIIPRSITADRVGLSVLTAKEVAPSTITFNEMAPETIGSGRIAPRGIAGDRIGLNVLTSAEIAARGISGGNVALGAITFNEIAAETIGSGRVAPRGLTGDRLALQAITLAETNDALKNPARAAFGLRTIASPNGTAVTSAGSDHFHSISFKHLPEEAQDLLIGARAKLRARRKKGDSDEMLVAVLGLLQMALDDENETAEERRERAKRGELEEEMHDYGNGLEPRRLKKWNVTTHPDLKETG